MPERSQYIMSRCCFGKRVQVPLPMEIARLVDRDPLRNVDFRLDKMLKLKTWGDVENIPEVSMKGLTMLFLDYNVHAKLWKNIFPQGKRNTTGVWIRRLLWLGTSSLFTRLEKGVSAKYLKVLENEGYLLKLCISL